MKKIFCIRHGHSMGDVEDRYGGDYDDDLSPLGVQQVTELADELAQSGIQIVYSSALLRAQKTAQSIVSRLGIDLVINPDLKERNRYGVLTGMTRAEAKQQFPALADLVRERKNTLPDAESDTQASQRMIAAFMQVAQAQEDCGAIVWHGGGMRALFRDYLQLGEVSEAGDCCWAELSLDVADNKFKLVNTSRLKWGN
jgi:broad specificity phosphatase PhoE